MSRRPLNVKVYKSGQLWISPTRDPKSKGTNHGEDKAVAMTISIRVRNIINKYNNPIPTFFSFVGKQVGVGDHPATVVPYTFTSREISSASLDTKNRPKLTYIWILRDQIDPN